MLQDIGDAVWHVGNQYHIHFLLISQQLALNVQHQITNLIKTYLRQPELFRQYSAYNLTYIDGTLIIFKQYVYDWIPGRGAGCSPVQHQRNMGYHVHIKCWFCSQIDSCNHRKRINKIFTEGHCRFPGFFLRQFLLHQEIPKMGGGQNIINMWSFGYRQRIPVRTAQTGGQLKRNGIQGIPLLFPVIAF